MWQLLTQLNIAHRCNPHLPDQVGCKRRLSRDVRKQLTIGHLRCLISGQTAAEVDLLANVLTMSNMFGV